jgi:hypothetical protein
MKTALTMANQNVSCPIFEKEEAYWVPQGNLNIPNPSKSFAAIGRKYF